MRKDFCFPFFLFVFNDYIKKVQKIFIFDLFNVKNISNFLFKTPLKVKIKAFYQLLIVYLNINTK